MHFTGHILATIRNAVNASNDGEEITIDNLQQNAAHGVHQARVRLKGDPNTYRLVLAPVEAPLQCGGRELTTYFAKPLGEG